MPDTSFIPVPIWFLLLNTKQKNNILLMNWEVRMSERWKPVIIFTDQSASFANGCEAGMLYERFKNEITDINASSHVENRAVLISMAEYFDWDISIKESGTEGWDYLIATKQQAKTKPKFTVVKND
jgi:hypothetical protein